MDSCACLQGCWACDSSLPSATWRRSSATPAVPVRSTTRGRVDAPGGRTASPRQREGSRRHHPRSRGKATVRGAFRHPAADRSQARFAGGHGHRVACGALRPRCADAWRLLAHITCRQAPDRTARRRRDTPSQAGDSPAGCGYRAWRRHAKVLPCDRRRRGPRSQRMLRRRPRPRALVVTRIRALAARAAPGTTKPIERRWRPPSGWQSVATHGGRHPPCAHGIRSWPWRRTEGTGRTCFFEAFPRAPASLRS